MICKTTIKMEKCRETWMVAKEGLEGEQSELPCCDDLWWGINRRSRLSKSSTDRSELIP